MATNKNGNETTPIRSKTRIAQRVADVHVRLPESLRADLDAMAASGGGRSINSLIVEILAACAAKATAKPKTK